MRQRSLVVSAALLLPLACGQKDAPPATDAKGGPAAPVAATPAAEPAAATPAAEAPAGDVATSFALVPKAANFVLRFDVHKISSSPLFPEAKKAFELDPENVKRMAVLLACGFGWETFQGFTMAVDTSGDESGVAILEAPGLGKPEKIECLMQGFAKELKDAHLQMQERDGRKVMVVGEKSEGVALFPNADTVLVTSANWYETIRDLADGKGESAAGGELDKLAQQADQSRAVWFAALVKDPASLKGSPFDGMASATASIDLGAGLGIAARGRWVDAASATKTATMLQQQLAGLKPMALHMGIPAPTLEKLAIAAEGDAVTVDLNLTTEELSGLQAALQKATGGLPGAPPAAPR
jgi:hypothetical protein